LATAPKPRPPAAEAPPFRTVADLLDGLGRVPPRRVRWSPLPGTATERDLLAALARKDGLCELIDGALVEKTMGFDESCLTGLLIAALVNHVARHRLGVVSAPDGLIRLAPGLVRAPDVAFTSRARLRGRKKGDPILHVAPDLAVEILSKSNTRREMDRKLREYFAAGTLLVWYVDPRARTVRVYSSPDRPTLLTASDTLDGSPVLPGFLLPLRDLFDAPQDRA
jgi:Uma2 family endonuclease